jgi:hypothetical protein
VETRSLTASVPLGRHSENEAPYAALGERGCFSRPACAPRTPPRLAKPEDLPRRTFPMPPAIHGSFGNRYAATALLFINKQEVQMGLGRGALLWLLGIPLPIIILLALFWHH